MHKLIEDIIRSHYTFAEYTRTSQAALQARPMEWEKHEAAIETRKAKLDELIEKIKTNYEITEKK